MTRKASTSTPTPRRAAGAGSITRLPSGRFWVRVWTPKGRVTDTCDTHEEAENLRRAIILERHDAAKRGAYDAPEPAPKPAPLTLATWGATWMEKRAARVRWPANDRSRWRLYVEPSTLATIPLSELRAKDVRAWLSELAATKRDGELLTTRTVRHVFNLVHKALADAVEDERIATNPAHGVKVQKRSEATSADAWTFLDASEVQAVEACAAMPERARLLFVVAIYTGLREGELWGLRWGDVRLTSARPEVIVRRSHDSAPKNGKVQPVPMLPRAREAFEQLRALERVDLEGNDPSPDALVFPSPRGHQRQPSDDGGWSTRKVRGKHRDGLKLLAGITRDVRFHDLRHTCASHLLMGTWGVTLALAEVRVFLRHGSVAMTERYAHLAPGHLHDRIATAPAKASADVSSADPVSPSTAGYVEPPDSPKPLLFRARDTGVGPVTLGFGDPRATLENKRFSRNVASLYPTPGVCDGVREVAEQLLRAVDEGLPAGELARQIARAVLRSEAPDSAPWIRAVAVLEGGPLRMRNAVELAGVILDATSAERVTDERSAG